MRDTLGTDRTDDTTELARDRTDWAEDRTLLANERTFAGWLRTGMASVALAIGLNAVFRPFEPTWAAKAVSTVFVLTAILIFLAAAQKSRAAQKRITSHDTEAQPVKRMTAVAALMILGAIGVGVILWLL